MKTSNRIKITYSKGNINSFGGLNFPDHIIGSTSSFTIINEEFGKIGSKAIFSYADLIRSYFLLSLCGGECAEDITENIRSELENVKGFDLCSADTFLRMQKELSTPKETYLSKTNIEHEFNVNTKINIMLWLLVDNRQLNPN